MRVTTNTGDETWSEPARWSMALLDDSDWQAGWIGIDSALNATDRMEGDSRLAARYLRKPFDVEGKVKNAWVRENIAKVYPMLKPHVVDCLVGFAVGLLKKGAKA